jgi:hypothetical protein
VLFVIGKSRCAFRGKRSGVSRVAGHAGLEGRAALMAGIRVPGVQAIFVSFVFVGE